MAIELNFTKTAITNLPPIMTGRKIYRDTGSSKSESTLHLYVGKKAKTFYFVKKAHGEKIEHRLGSYLSLPIETARKRAKALSVEVDNGGDPRISKKAKRQRGLSLGEVVEQYIVAGQARAEKPLRDSTVANYRRMMEVHFSADSPRKRDGRKEYSKPGKGWVNKSATGITDESVQQWYNKAVKYSVSSANAATRAVKAAYAHQIQLSRKQRNTTFIENPFASIKLTKEKPAEDYIEPDEIGRWWAAVGSLSNSVTRDYLKFVLMTGLRRREASTLTWEQVDLKRKRTLTLMPEQTKNGEQLVLPLSDYLIELLTERKESGAGVFVFPGTGKSGHLTEPKKAMAKVNGVAGTYVTVHGLRRTYSNICQWQVGMPDYARKQLLNHSVGNDVTARHYTNLPLDQMRRFQQMVTDKIREFAQIENTVSNQLMQEVES